MKKESDSDSDKEEEMTAIEKKLWDKINEVIK